MSIVQTTLPPEDMVGVDNQSLYGLYSLPSDHLFSTASPSNHSNFTDQDYACYGLTDDAGTILAHKIYLYASLIFVVFGLVGNTLSVLVFSSRGMRSISSNFYLLSLAVSDSFYLISVFFAKLLSTLRCLHFTDTKADLMNHSDILCKLLHYISDLFSDYSSCLILCFTIERVIAVYMPLKFKEICTVERAKAVSLSIFFVIVIAIAPYHFMMIGLHDDFPVCIVRLQWEVEFTVAYMAEALVFRIIPVFVIAVLNVFIIIRVTEVNSIKKRRRAAQTLNQAQSTNADQNGGTAAAARRKSKREDKSMQLTIMLILVSTSYILVYLPVLIHYVIWSLYRSDVISVSSRGLEIAQKYTSMMYIAGFGINFFLYTIGGKIFRDQLHSILCGNSEFLKYKGTSSEMTTLV